MKLKKEFKIGLFVIIVLIATFVVINILRGTDILGRSITLSSRFDDVESLVESAPVQIRGYAAGRVDKVEYDPDEDNFLVECSVDKRFRIPVDSRMTLYSTSIMGGKGIRIDYGTSGEYVKDGSVLSASSDTDLISSLTEGISPLLSKINILLDSLSEAINGINGGLLSEENKENVSKAVSHLEATLAAANSLSNELNGKSDEILNIVGNLSRLSDQLEPLEKSVSNTLENADEITSQIASGNLEKTLGNLNDAISDINRLVDNLNEPLTKIMSDADSLINDIKNSPKKYIKVTVF